MIFSKSTKKLSVVKTVLQIAFKIATVIAVLYIFRELWHQWPSVSKWRPDWQNLAILFLVTIIYGVSLFLLAEMWQRLLTIFAPGEVDRRKAHSIYARTQIAKYLPGNVFHYVGRHLLLSDLRINHATILKISVLEIILMLFGALVVAFVALGENLGNIIGMSSYEIRFLFCILLIGLAISGLIGLPGTLKQRCIHISKLACFSVGFFLCQGAIFLTICLQLDIQFSLLPVFASSVSWIAGYVVPGAPGGLGVREITLYFLLKPYDLEASVLIVAAIFRAVTIMGDMVCFLIGHFLSPPQNSKMT